VGTAYSIRSAVVCALVLSGFLTVRNSITRIQTARWLCEFNSAFKEHMTMEDCVIVASQLWQITYSTVQYSIAQCSFAFPSLASTVLELWDNTVPAVLSVRAVTIAMLSADRTQRPQ